MYYKIYVERIDRSCKKWSNYILNRLWNSFRDFIAKYHSECLKDAHNFTYHFIFDFFFKLSMHIKNRKLYKLWIRRLFHDTLYHCSFFFIPSILSFVSAKWMKRQLHCLLYLRKVACFLEHWERATSVFNKFLTTTVCA